MLDFQMSDDSGDEIHIEQLEIFARVGVPRKEREKPQRLTASITLWPAHDIRDLNDEIGRTVNYSSVCKEVKKFARDNSCKLIETLADRVAGHLLQTFAIRRIRVEVRKFALADAAYSAITVTSSVPVD